MTRLERKLLLINGLLGTGLTLLVLLLDWGGQLQALERWFYDQRALYCQFFAKPPTDRLVYLDIDDNALERIERWPWKRSTMATIIDEVAAAGPELIFLDVLYSEPQEPSFVPQEEGGMVKIDHDAQLAESLLRAGNVIVPVALDFSTGEKEQTRADIAMFEALKVDLELTPAEVGQRLKDRGITPPVPEQVFNDRFVIARRAAMYERIDREVSANATITPQDLRPKLLPRTDPRQIYSPLLRLLTAQYEKVEKLRPLQRFSRPGAPRDPPFISAEDETAPLAMFTRPAGGSGFVNYIEDPDGVVRQIPLLAQHRGRIVPQIGFVIACKLLGADPNSVSVADKEIVIPCADGRRIRIPIRTATQTGTGRSIGALASIPYIGGRDWQTMYDPARREERQHVPVNVVWQVIQTRQAISFNNTTADHALLETLWMVGEDKPKEYAQKKLTPDDAETRAAWMRQVLEVVSNNLKQFEGGPPPNEEELKQIAEFKRVESGMRAIMGENQQLAAQLISQRSRLKSLLANRAILIGSIATGNAYDFKPTSLHEKCPGVLIHGVVANGILTQELWRTAPLWITRVLTILTGLATTAFVLRLRTSRAAMAGISLAALYLLINGIVVFDYFNLIVGVAGPIVAVLVTWLSCQLVEILVEKAERRRITRRFSSYADPALVRYVIEHPEQDVMSGHEREMTVVFTDLAGFTTISETLREKVVPLLNEYLGMMAKIVAKHNGYVNKFLGDGIMFFYNAPRDNPDHAADAIVTVLEMQEAVAGFYK
jgi:CHASE2 domain-containing sensor protein